MTTVLPTGWVKVRLGDIAQIKTGTRNNQDKKDLGRYPFFVRSSQVERIDSYSYDCEAILVPGEGGIGSIFHYIHGKFEVHQRVYKISDFAAGISGKFIYYYMTHFFGEQAARNSVKATVDSLRLPTFKSFEIVLSAEVREQQAISRALEDADSSIASLERLITKKQAIKQGMMQELLTGRTRLPGFSMPWRTKMLDAVSDIDPETIPAETSPSQMIDYVSLEDVSRGRILASSRVEFSNAPSRARRAVRPLDVLFGTVRPNLQSHALYRGGLRNPVVSTGFAVIRARSSLADPQFLFYVVMSSLTSSQVERIIAGSNYPAVSSRDVRMFEYLLPEIAEQEAIGAALADAEAELSVLHARLQKACAVKQGMMQELLTGRTRLPVQETVA